MEYFWDDFQDENTTQQINSTLQVEKINRNIQRFLRQSKTYICRPCTSIRRHLKSVISSIQLQIKPEFFNNQIDDFTKQYNYVKNQNIYKAMYLSSRENILS